MKKAIVSLLSVTGGIAAGGLGAAKFLQNKNRKNNELMNKVFNYYFLMDQWLTLKQNGKSLVPYFLENGYKRVAIYGFKELGQRLLDELKNTEIQVSYIIDQNADSMYTELDIYKPEGNLPAVDAVIVTASYYYDEIEEEMLHHVDCPVISIKDIISAFYEGNQ